MTDLSTDSPPNLALFHGPNAGYILELYDRYRLDPSSVDQETRAAFDRGGPPEAAAATAPAADACSGIGIAKIVGAARITRLVRELGHLTAHIDPLNLAQPPGDPGLELATHGLETSDLAALPASVVGGPLAEGAANALEALGRLRRAYSGSIGYEDDHIQVPEERDWLRRAAETDAAWFFEDADKRDLLERLTAVEVFENFLDRTFNKAKRFSVEGTDMLVPMLDLIIRDASAGGTREVVMGMAHRGRLNVLAHILGKPYAAILQEFQSAKQEEGASVAGGGLQGWTGDVKYHLGAHRTFSENGVSEMPITLTPNPSHLEFVDPVVMGRARAAQEERSQPGQPHQDMKASLAIMIHGDAAFPGQGVVAETLNLSQLPGYTVGGTIHIIVNNQIGFTTMPRDARSTLYASDLAKGFEIPIVHVNADDPLACLVAARLALDYREKFSKDFLIDLVGYRRYGHNEGDEPSFTQPRMYEAIRSHPTVRALWAQQLEAEGLVTRDEAEALVTAAEAKLQQAMTSPPPAAAPRTASATSASVRPPETAVPAERLEELNEMLLARPEGFTVNAKLDKILQRRRTGLHQPGGIDWGHAEALAFASILADGTPIRLTGQDSERATFGQRNSVLHDPVTGARFVPLQTLPAARASFAVYNSPLSENAVLGFEYGYSMHAAGVLVLWEGQFGDFANGAQVIIDQFLVSGHAKWRQTPSLVLLLPHGYEGQGPEHSSARLERFLQLAASDNLRIVNCTTAAQYFHVLRRQAGLLEAAPRPLIIMTPKSLLRKPEAGSSLSDLSLGTFQPVLNDPEARARAGRITRLVLCSGKVYVDLITSKTFGTDERVAVVRVEELYPFPERALGDVLSGYPHLRQVVWLQEEPRNMGAWSFMEPHLRDLIGPQIEILYAGRPASASPAEGSGSRHAAEQSRIIAAALSAVPDPERPAELNPQGAKNAR